MPTPKQVFDNPLQYLNFLQSANFEGQFFDWKEARVNNPNQISTLKRQIKEGISAFANSNREGGLIVLGIADGGIIKGTQHIDEITMNNILQVTRDLKNHATQTREVDMEDLKGNRLYLLYTPWIPNAICETIENFPKGWKRVGPQNLPLIDQDRDQLKRDKGIVDFEISYCCVYDPDELDNNVIAEVKKALIEDRGARYDLNTQEMLANIGAIRKENDKYFFTNAGYLFFASNPRKRFECAFVRVLHYGTSSEDTENLAETTFDRDFEGPLSNIIRDLRGFLRDTSVFQTSYEGENDSESTNEPEYPFIAVDEALVNAIIHREYAVSTPIFCTVYKDKLVVKNPGNILQQVPQSFSLAEITLESLPRNPKLVEWMRLMKDEAGTIFVRALSEGTRRMREEMEHIGLPAPYYETGMNTAVTLYNHSKHSTTD